MKIIVLTETVPDLVEDLEVDSTASARQKTEYLKFTLNEFDDHALEEALLLKEAGGGEVTAIALDGEEVDKMLFTALAKGADRALKVTGAGDAGRQHVAALAGIFEQVAEPAAYDLVLTGVQAADDRDGQLAPMVAALLDLPCVEVVTGVAAATAVTSTRSSPAARWPSSRSICRRCSASRRRGRRRATRRYPRCGRFSSRPRSRRSPPVAAPTATASRSSS